MTTVATSALPLSLIMRGKVRDVYSVDDARVLLVATDRVSAFDVVMREAVPHKGAVLTQLTAWWLRQLEPHLQHHMLTADADEIAREVPVLDGARDSLRLRAMLCRRVRIVPVECVVRGYITGSAWKEYRATGTLAGEAMPPACIESDSPNAARVQPGHQSRARARREHHTRRGRQLVGEEVAAELERLSRFVYDFGCRVAEPRGIILADTKFEFGHAGRPAGAGRRGSHARQLALLADGPVRAGQVAAQLRQAAVAGLSRTRSGAPVAGTVTRRHHRCHPRSSMLPASVTSTPIGA